MTSRRTVKVSKSDDVLHDARETFHVSRHHTLEGIDLHGFSTGVPELVT